MEYQIIHIDETDSTNRWLKENGGEAAMVVVAEYQTAGKGCGKNSWESERGKNLTFSMLVHPCEHPLRIQAKEQFRITEVVSVALCKTLQPYIYNKVEIKWPNDIYVGDKKLCGILIENRLQGSVIKDSIIGIGLNVNQQVFLSDAPNPVSMWQLTGQETNREVLLEAFLQAFNEAWESETISKAYRQRQYRREGYHAFCDKDGRFEAKLRNVLNDGMLVLEDREGQRRNYAFKEIKYII